MNHRQYPLLCLASFVQYNAITTFARVLLLDIHALSINHYYGLPVLSVAASALIFPTKENAPNVPKATLTKKVRESPWSSEKGEESFPTTCVS